MIFPEQRFRLKDGRTCALRAAQPEDAEAMLDYLRTTAGETPYLLREPEEVTMTIEAERAFLKNSLDDPRALMLTVWVDGQLAGNGSLSPVGSVSRVRHRCSLGIAFYQKYCGLGLGRIVLEALEDAAPHGLRADRARRVQLQRPRKAPLRKDGLRMLRHDAARRPVQRRQL